MFMYGSDFLLQEHVFSPTLPLSVTVMCVLQVGERLKPLLVGVARCED